MSEKKYIRDEIRKLKSALSDFEKNKASESVFSRLIKMNEWDKAKNILLYYSLPDELQTNIFFEKITDKKFFLPKIEGNDLIVLPYKKNKLTKGTFSILEPEGDTGINIDILDIIVVPGVAYDKELNRLGRGKGYYDKLLSFCKALKIGICYDLQLIDKVPTETHDIKMDIIITPTKIIQQ